MSNTSSGRIYFDSSNREIKGPGYSIKHVGQRPNPPYYDIFLYSSNNAKFYFIAERLISRTGSELDSELVDTEIYDVKEIGYYYSDDPAYLKEKSISDEQRRAALRDIEQALYFDVSAFYKRPPKEVRISARR